MQVIPAIDLEGGRSRIVFWPGAAAGVGAPTDRPETIAARFVERGAPAVHLVDFDGARAGSPRNLEAVSRVAAAVATPLQLAGGLEDPDAIRLAFAAGATRVVVSIALADRPDDLRACVSVAGDWLAVGLDARPERIAAFPWHRGTTPSLDALLDELAALGIRRFLVSHVAAAGDAEALRRTIAERDADVLVAGGIRTLAELTDLRDAGVAGVILGEPLLSGALDYEAAREAAA
ncbi:MAG TPA: HisA/HisF-related TIM barrel protein [Candidatus Limnocylindrales bacterium]|nr:HisA/HisF-related TIM barrel protein [Candidatus Limnocylindrales bacterium]